jgi:hypothetical protein
VIGLAWVLDRSVFELLATGDSVDVTDRLALNGDAYAIVLYSGLVCRRHRFTHS